VRVRHLAGGDTLRSREPEAFVSVSVKGTAMLAATYQTYFSTFQVLQNCDEFRIIWLSKSDCGLVDKDNQLVGAYFGEAQFRATTASELA
jgi:hypothetical protein